MLGHRLTPARRRRTYLLWCAACIGLLTAGTILIGSALNTGPHAPRPHPADARAPLGPTVTSSPAPTVGATTSSRPPEAVPTTTPSPGRPTARATRQSHARASVSLARSGKPRALPPSTPTSVVVPAIGISSAVSQLGLNADGTIQVPPLTRNSPVGWYRLSPTPGEIGTSIMLGHIDSAAYGPAVFFRLAALRPGDEIDVHRADGSTAVFRVDRVAEYPKTQFPSQLVYGTTSYPSLRLITCGGSFDPAARSYRDNTVVYATLTTHH